VKLRHIAILGGLLAGIIGFNPVTFPAAEAAKPAKATITEEAKCRAVAHGQDFEC
jgi:hypothetical protein